ncbi:strigolactone esterase RMS3 [Carica papaya]|uniref:strigolactone esterase RMS3 n=1 Tax=Carica papaya TaxID=3649 RepID=UPI000B8CD4A0|nr:strigolactone esterase RMS3 [Carica papaya]
MVPVKGSISAAMNARIIGCSDSEEHMVLAHGFGADQSVWDKIVPILAQHCKVLVFDWAFSGAVTVKDTTLFDPVKYSSYDAFADDLILLLDELSFKSSVFVGHSMSAMIGCIASIKRPDLFNRLILVGASPRYINAEGYEGGFESRIVDNMISNVETNYEEWATAFASLVVDPQDPLSADKFRNCLRRMRNDVALSLANTVFHSDHRHILPEVFVPCTIIQTTNDVIVPISVAYYMDENIRGKSTVEMVDTCGHFPQLTAHLQLLDVIGGVLGRAF